MITPEVNYTKCPAYDPAGDWGSPCWTCKGGEGPCPLTPAGEEWMQDWDDNS